MEMRSMVIAYYKKKRLNLKGHCRGDFAVCLLKLLKYLTKNLFSNMKLP